VRAHQHSTAAATDSDESIGKSRGGNSTKIHLAVDSYSLPVYFELSGGQVNDIVHANGLLNGSPSADYVIADKGYAKGAVKQQGAEPVIPYRKNSKKTNEGMDWCLYRSRHLVENTFGTIKYYLAISNRYESLQQSCASMPALAFTMMWLPMHI